MTTYGQIKEFCMTGSNWSNYIEQVQFYFDANEIVEESKKKAVLLASAGTPLFNLIKSLAIPRLIKDITYQELITIVNKHFTPTPNLIVERFKFNIRMQGPEESMTDYIAELRKLSQNCQFKDLDDMLRDRIVCGMRDEMLQKKLLVNTELTFQKVVDAAIAEETARKNVIELRQNAETEIHKVVEKKRHKSELNTRDGRHCWRCDRKGHTVDQCRYINEECHFCKKQGHLERACITKKKKINQNYRPEKPTQKPEHATNIVEGLPVEPNESQEEYVCCTTGTTTLPPITAKVTLDGHQATMEIDSGAGYSIMSETNFKRIFQEKRILRRPIVKLKTWGAERVLPVLGELDVNVKYQNHQCKLPLIIIKGEGPTLMGRNWFNALSIQLKNQINQMELQEIRKGELPEQVKDNSEVFAEELGEYRGEPVKIRLKPGSCPRFVRPRQVPYALKKPVEEALEKAVRDGILEPVATSDYATPIVPVIKPDRSIRICGDYKSTVNVNLQMETYPLPANTEVFAALAGGTLFTKLDLDRAYTQVKVDEESAKLLTLNTHKGLYKVNRLYFGIATAPSIFQRLMENLFAGIPGVIVYLDDILITGSSTEEHWKRVNQVLSKLKQMGLRVKLTKCMFATKMLEFLGFKITPEGIGPTEEKVKAIQEAPTPKNKEELQAFLGLMNFYERFIDNKSTIMEPMYKLLKNKERWSWGKAQEKAFIKAKEVLQSEKILVHYTHDLPIVVAGDASPYGVGAVISHRFPDGTEKPIAYGSRTLQQSERNYSQLDKEALSIIFAVKKFHRYLAGRPFTIITDHKPLLGILNPRKPIPEIIPPRMLRWSLILGSYKYNLEYRPGKQHGNADGLSRVPLPSKPAYIPEPAEVLFLEEQEEQSIITATEIARVTERDPILARVVRGIQHGWNENNLPPELQLYQAKATELSVQRNCLLWGSRVVIPQKLQKRMLELLHEVHQGTSHTKALARSYVWWPNINKNIEEMIGKCHLCLQHRNQPAKQPIIPWKYPKQPWARVHIDFAGPYKGRTYLIAVDAYSKWPEVKEMSNITAAKTIETLREIFAQHGLPRWIVSDNGRTFVSEEFQLFLKGNGIEHKLSAPYHPASNGQAERTVQTIKSHLKKYTDGDSREMNKKMANTLLMLRVTPSSATGLAPAELLMNRKLRTRLDAVHPDNNETLWEKRQNEQFEEAEERGRKPHQVGEDVMFRNYERQGPKWNRGTITEVFGPRNVEVETEGRTTRRHTDQLLPVTRLTEESQASATPLRNLSPRRSSRSRKPPTYLKDFNWDGKGCGNPDQEAGETDQTT